MRPALNWLELWDTLYRTIEQGGMGFFDTYTKSEILTLMSDLEKNAIVKLKLKGKDDA